MNIPGNFSEGFLVNYSISCGPLIVFAKKFHVKYFNSYTFVQNFPKCAVLFVQKNKKGGEGKAFVLEENALARFFF